jgi:uncharacterized protein YutE (UPF0331/DUF86 family)
MVDANLIAAKLRELSDRIDRVRALRKPDAAALAADRDARELVSFNLMLAVQTCADIASHLIADEGWPPATTLAEAFQELGQRGVLTSETTEALRQAVGLRNLVAHGYANIDPELLFAAAVGGLVDLEHFERDISVWVLRQP